MKGKSFIGLAVVTILVVVAAALVWQMREQDSSGGVANQPLYPGLIERINDIERVTITNANGSFTMQRADQGWGMAERAGYPVDPSAIREALVTLAELRTIEAQTSKPDRYARLEVEEPNKPDSESVLLVAEGKAGAKLASLIVGRNLTEKQGGGVFVRKADEAQAWLAQGQFKPRIDPVNWLERMVTDIDERRIRRITVRHPDGQHVVIEKAEPTTKDFALNDVPAGKKSKSSYELASVAATLEFLTLEDVGLADRVQFPDKGITAEYTTFDGLKIDIRIGSKGEDTWVTFKASATEPHPGAAKLREKRDEDSDAGKLGKQMKSPEEVAKEVAAINANTAKWGYRLTGFKTDKLTSRTDDLVEDIEEKDKKKGDKPG